VGKDALKFTLETSGEDVKFTLETSGEDLKNTLETSGEDVKNQICGIPYIFFCRIMCTEIVQKLNNGSEWERRVESEKNRVVEKFKPTIFTLVSSVVLHLSHSFRV
jgi:hypothetical protein